MYSDSRYGEIKTFEGDLISDFIRSYGEWAYFECVFVNSILLKPAYLIFDIGAFIGTFSMGMSLDNAHTKFVAIEMNPQCWPLLEYNLMTHVEEYSVVKAAVGQTVTNNAGYSILGPSDNAGGSQVLRYGNNNSLYHEVTITHLARKYGVPDLIKMDIEGMEVEAIQYSQNWILEFKPDFWIECNEDVKSIKLFELLKWLGYKIYYFAFPSFNKNNFKKSTDKIFPCAYEAGLLALKSDREVKLTPELIDAECLLYEVHSSQDLRDMLWKTPRWANKEWIKMSKVELISILGRMQKGQLRKEFLKK